LFEHGGSEEVALVDEEKEERAQKKTNNSKLEKLWEWFTSKGVLPTWLTEVEAEIERQDPSTTEENESTSVSVILPSPSHLPSLLSSSSQNHASLDCSSSIIASSPGVRSASSILSYSPDKYLLMPCSPSSQSKSDSYGWTIVELCQEVLVHSIVVGNFEFFSSGFRDVRVKGLGEEEKAKRGGVLPKWDGDDGGWKELGILRAENVRGLQAWKVEAAGFYRYLRFEFLDVRLVIEVVLNFFSCLKKG
jgi:hypothetical protein